MTFDLSRESQLEKLLRLRNQSNEDIQKIKTWKVEISELKQSAVADVNNKFDELKVDLETKREGICEQVRTIYDEKLAEFDQTISKLEQQLKEIDQLNFTSQRPVLPNRGVQLSIDYASVTNAIQQLTPTSKQPTFEREPLWVSPFVKTEPLSQQSDTSPATPSWPSKSYQSPPLKRFCPESGNEGPAQSTPADKTFASLTTEEAATKTSAMKTAKNVRRTIRCKKCRKPRCIYSEQPISTDITNHLTKWQFKCGKAIPQWNRHCTELAIDSGDCNTDVSITYFSSDRKHVCYKCGSLDELQECSSDQMQNFTFYHPVCRACASRGIKPRTRKKCQSRKTDTKKTEPEIYTQKADTKKTESDSYSIQINLMR